MLIVKKLSWPIYEKFLNAQEHTIGKIVMDKPKLLPPRIQLSTEKTAPSGSPIAQREATCGTHRMTSYKHYYW